MTTVTSKGFHTGLCTSRSGKCFCVRVLTGPNSVHRLVGNHTRNAGSLNQRSVSIGQFSGDNGNRYPLFSLVVGTGMLDLIGHSFRSGSHDDGAGTADIGTTCSGVYITRRQICHSVDFNVGVLISAHNILSRIRIEQIHMSCIAGAAEGRTFMNRICSHLGSPLIVVIDVDLISITQGTGCILADDQSCTGMQSNILGHGHATGMHGNIHVTIDRKNIILGIDGLGSNQTQLHRKTQTLNGKASVHVDFQSTGGLVVILYHIALGNIEHSVGSDERNLRALNTNQRDCHRHISVFGSSRLQGHRNFNILNIILGHGENTIAVSDHTGGVITTAPVLDLEALVDSTALFHGHRTATLDITPRIQLTAIVNGNSTARFHLDKATLTDGRTLTTRCTLCSRKAQRAVNNNVCTFRHGHLAVNRGRTERGVRSYRCSRAQGICIIERNQQSDITGDSIVPCRQNTVVCQNNGFTGRCLCCVQSFVQAFIQFSVDEETGILSKDRLNRHIICRLQLVRCGTGKDHMGISIHPSQEACTIFSSSLHLDTRHRNIHRSTGTRSISCNSDAAQVAIVPESNLRGFLNCGASEILHYQLVCGTVFCRGNGNRETFACLHNLFKATGGASCNLAVNFQFIDGRSSPTKGNFSLATAVVTDFNGRGLGAGTDAKNSSGSFCSNRKLTVFPGVIGSTGNRNAHTVNRCVSAGSSLNYRKHRLEDISESNERLYVGMLDHIRRVYVRQILDHRLDLRNFRNGRLVDRPGLSIDSRLDLRVGHLCIDAVALQNGSHGGCHVLRHVGRCRCDFFLMLGMLCIMALCRKRMQGQCRNDHNRR